MTLIQVILYHLSEDVQSGAPLAKLVNVTRLTRVQHGTTMSILDLLQFKELHQKKTYIP